MTALRRRMREDMQVRNFPPHTQDAYIRAVAHFTRYFMLPPETLGADHARQFVRYLVQERKVSWSCYNQIRAGLSRSHRHRVARSIWISTRAKIPSRRYRGVKSANLATRREPLFEPEPQSRRRGRTTATWARSSGAAGVSNPRRISVGVMHRYTPTVRLRSRAPKLGNVSMIAHAPPPPGRQHTQHFAELPAVHGSDDPDATVAG